MVVLLLLALFNVTHARSAMLVKNGDGVGLAHTSSFYGTLISHDHLTSSKSKFPSSISLGSWNEIRDLIAGVNRVSGIAQINEVVAARVSRDPASQLHERAREGNVFAMLEYATLLRKQLGSSASSFEEATVFAYTFTGCVRLYAMLRSTVFTDNGQIDLALLSHEVASLVAPVFKHYQKSTGFFFSSSDEAVVAWDKLAEGGIIDQIKELHRSVPFRDASEIFATARNERVSESVDAKIERLIYHFDYSKKIGDSPEFVQLLNGSGT